MGNIPPKASVHDESLDICDETVGIQVRDESDPRSPSVDIDRTPLLQKHESTPNAKPITKNMDLTKECFDKWNEIEINPAMRAIMNNFDPRSPSVDIERTPLGFILKNHESMLAKLHPGNPMKNLVVCGDEIHNESVTGVEKFIPKNLCDDLCDLSFQSALDHNESSSDNNMSTVEIPENIGDIKKELVCSSSPPQERKVIYGLLETNLDYTETDLDTVRRKRKVIPKPEITSSDELPKCDNAPSMAKNSESVDDLSSEDPRSPTVGIDRTPLVVAEFKSVKSYRNSQIKEVFRNKVKLQQRKYSDVKLQEKDIIKKVTDSLLIYEDDDSDSTIKILTNIPSNEGSRTPLACVKNLDTTSSKPNTPHDNIIDMKVNKSGNIKSKIPVRISKSPIENMLGSDLKSIKSRRIIMDSENTPPQPRKACWDVDNSVVL